MKKKFLLLLVFVMLFSLFAVGCNDSKVNVEVKTPEEAAKMAGDPLENLTIKEKEWLIQLDMIREQIKKDYISWEQGKITKEEFMKQLGNSQGSVKTLRKAYGRHMDANPLSDQAMNDIEFKNGLAYGKKLRSLVNNFIFLVTEGARDIETKKLKKPTDQQIKELYQRDIVKQYDEYKAKLLPALEKNAKK